MSFYVYKSQLFIKSWADQSLFNVSKEKLKLFKAKLRIKVTKILPREQIGSLRDILLLLMMTIKASPLDPSSLKNYLLLQLKVIMKTIKMKVRYSKYSQ